MSAFDGNRDGFIDRREASDAQEFAAGDVTRDGALNRAEFARVDSKCCSVTDRCKRLSPVCADPREFDQYDTNRDGLVDTPEFARGEAAEHRCKSFFRSFTCTKIPVPHRWLVNNGRLIPTDAKNRNIVL